MAFPEVASVERMWLLHSRRDPKFVARSVSCWEAYPFLCDLRRTRRCQSSDEAQKRDMGGSMQTKWLRHVVTVYDPSNLVHLWNRSLNSVIINSMSELNSNSGWWLELERLPRYLFVCVHVVNHIPMLLSMLSPPTIVPRGNMDRGQFCISVHGRPPANTYPRYNVHNVITRGVKFTVKYGNKRLVSHLLQGRGGIAQTSFPLWRQLLLLLSPLFCLCVKFERWRIGCVHATLSSSRIYEAYHAIDELFWLDITVTRPTKCFHKRKSGDRRCGTCLTCMP